MDATEPVSKLYVENRQDGCRARCRSCGAAGPVERFEISTLAWQSTHRCEEQPLDDAVDHPSHYTLGGVEVIDAIEAWDLGFHAGNTVKYVARAGKKGGPEKEVEDLKKARWYLDRLIEQKEQT